MRRTASASSTDAGRTTGARRNVESPFLANRRGIRFVWFETTRKCRGIRAHFRAALNATMTTNWHEACAIAANIAASKRKVHNAANSGAGVFVLRDSH